MSNRATFHYMRDDEFRSGGTLPTDHSSPQEFAERMVKGLHRSDTTHVLVWFGELDGRLPDATAQVPA